MNARAGHYTQQEFDAALQDVQPPTLSDDECQVLRERVSMNLAEFIDFGSISYQQIQALSQASSHLFNAINAYNNADYTADWHERLNDLIYISMVKTAIKSKHQRYLAHNSNLIQQLRQFAPLFHQMNNIAVEISKYNSVKYQLEVGDADITGFIDFHL